MPPRKILVATDFSEPSEPAVVRAAALARSRADAELVVVHVFDAESFSPTPALPAAAEVLAEERNALRLLLEGRCGALAREGVNVRPLLVEGPPAEKLVEAAREERPDLLVVGSHGRTGIRRLWMGSVAEQVVRMSPAPVLVARAGGEFARILCATDFSEQAERALGAALELAAPGARVDVVHALHIASTLQNDPAAPMVARLVPEMEAEVRRQGADLVARHAREGAELAFSHELAPPRDAILGRLEKGGYDLVAVGTHGLRGLERVLIGSVAEAVVRHAPCSVLVAR